MMRRLALAGLGWLFRRGDLRVRSTLVLGVAVVGLATAIAAYAEQLPAGSVRVLPPAAGSPSTLRWSASFAQPAAAELQAYNVYIARGYRFDRRAAHGTCTVAQARSSACPRKSKIGGGVGQVTVLAPSAPRREFSLTIAFFITAPQRRGDVAGLVLAGREPTSGLTFALVGRIVPLRRGPYGLELRFANTAAELPSGVTVQLHRVDVRFGTQRTVIRGASRRRLTYHLLTNPTVCPRRGWPFLLTVTYSTGPEKYSAYGACTARRR
jgi:hypothetical protein